MGKRKVVLIMVDSQRTDMLGCYGNPGMKTPNIDRLAEDGTRFTRAYTCQPVCGPARAAIFTGLFPHSNGSWANVMPLGDNVKTVGQRLSDNGVRSAYVGKWHLDGGDYFGLGRCPEGWDSEYWYDMRIYLDELSPEERVRSRQPASIEEGIDEEFTYAHRCSNRAVNFLENHGTDDFLLVVSYDEPHHPYLCPKKYVEMYRDYELPQGPNARDQLGGKPEHQRIWAGDHLDQSAPAAPVIQPYLFGCNSFVDHQIGRVLKAVDRLAPDAMVIFTSDHGDALGSHQLDSKGPAMYDEIARVPFITRIPGSTAGRSCSHPTSHIDISPTILEYMGLPIPALLEGRSMLPTIRDSKVVTNDRIFMEFGRYETDHDGFGGFQPVRACFDGRHKLVVNLMVTDELYDLVEDPDEMVNLIDHAGHSEARDALHDSILEWMNETRDPFRGYYWERRPWRTGASPATWEYTLMTRQREHEEYEPRQLEYLTGLEMKSATRPKD